MKVTLLDYGAGNIQSVQFALERLGVNLYFLIIKKTSYLQIK